MSGPPCQICQHNLFSPFHQRRKCPHHPKVEVHHHHHYNPPTAPPAPATYPQSQPGYYPPPQPGFYPPSQPTYTPPIQPVYYPPVQSGYTPPAQGFTRSFSWVDSSLGCAVPPTAVRGGSDIDGQPIYVGRAHHERDLIPAKVIPGRRCCYVAYNGKEHSKSNYQILCDSRSAWVPASGGSVHADAVEGGRTESGETLYIGRVFHKNSQTVGKIHPSHGSCYISFDGKEIAYKSYEVLISRRY